jgi:hypothetical protein
MVDYDNVLVVYYDRVLVLCEQVGGSLLRHKMVNVDGSRKGCRFVRTRRREDERWNGIHPTTLLQSTYILLFD